MTEAQATQKLLAEIKKRHPRAVVFKHCDRFTKAIPDISITVAGRTFWLEVKLLKVRTFDEDTEWEPDNLVQAETLRRLAREGGRAFWIFIGTDGYQRMIRAYNAINPPPSAIEWGERELSDCETYILGEEA